MCLSAAAWWIRAFLWDLDSSTKAYDSSRHVQVRLEGQLATCGMPARAVNNADCSWACLPAAVSQYCMSSTTQRCCSHKRFPGYSCCCRRTTTVPSPPAAWTCWQRP
jgi:hypothetical protein